MRDEEIVAHFDGRGRVHLRFGHVDAEKARRMVEIAHALGYRPLSTGTLGRGGIARYYERDDAPHARRRAAQTIERLRAGGPVLPEVEPSPPPPPPPPPPLTPRQPPPRPRRSMEPQPPPPVGPPGPRIPPRPPYPPPPPPTVTPESAPE
ncbi:hypothetical protein ACIF83_16395 [Streptomyces sp. NPDC085866]|uniref:hypothetical protein n=1 Tax=Streptomyces sp. NPDC085866 TaxID=3365736 RepID=UPI0037D9445F